MSDHDPLCSAQEHDDIFFCVCEFIAKVRADERTIIAEGLEKLLVEFSPEMPSYWALREAVRIARYGPSWRKGPIDGSNDE